MRDQPLRLQECVRKVLNELVAEALLFLKDPRLEVVVVSERRDSVWAYFPIHRRRHIARELHSKPATRILLVFSVASFQNESTTQFKDHLRDHIGHVLLYLRSPKPWNDCPEAMREWRASTPSAAEARAMGIPARVAK